MNNPFEIVEEKIARAAYIKATNMPVGNFMDTLLLNLNDSTILKTSTSLKSQQEEKLNVAFQKTIDSLGLQKIDLVELTNKAGLTSTHYKNANQEYALGIKEVGVENVYGRLVLLGTLNPAELLHLIHEYKDIGVKVHLQELQAYASYEGFSNNKLDKEINGWKIELNHSTKLNQKGELLSGREDLEIKMNDSYAKNRYSVSFDDGRLFVTQAIDMIDGTDIRNMYCASTNVNTINLFRGKAYNINLVPEDEILNFSKMLVQKFNQDSQNIEDYLVDVSSTFSKVTTLTKEK